MIINIRDADKSFCFYLQYVGNWEGQKGVKLTKISFGLQGKTMCILVYLTTEGDKV